MPEPKSYASRRTVLRATVGGVVVGGAVGNATATNSAAYHVWALDQKQDVAHILRPMEGGTLREVATIEDLPSTPHMISFTEDGDYGFIASTGGGATTMVDAKECTVIDTHPTGAGSHFAGVQPRSDRVHVDVIGEEKIVELEYDDRGLTESRSLSISLAEREPLGFTSNSPICHDYRPDGKFAYVTFGPAFEDGGLAILDTRSMRFKRIYDPDLVQTNCGAVHHPSNSKIYLNGGDSDGDSPWYVVDTRTQHVVRKDHTDYGESGGRDAHGMWFTPDEKRLWMFNRQSNDGVIIDPDDDRVVDILGQIGPHEDDRPDISEGPSGADHRYMYITLRGSDPEPAEVPGVNPGVQVLDTAERSRLAADGEEMVDGVWQPDPFLGADAHDFHGIGIRER